MTISPLKYGGQTASENFVHALACTLHASADSTSARDVTLSYGPGAGNVVRQFSTPYTGLTRLVGNSLKPSTLKALVSRHPSLFVQDGLLTVRLPLGHEANPHRPPVAKPFPSLAEQQGLPAGTTPEQAARHAVQGRYGRTEPVRSIFG